MIADADMSEPYMWVPLASVLEVVAFVNHIRTLVDQTGTLTLRGEGAGVTDHVVNAGDASWTFAAPQPTVTNVPVATNDHTVNAGDVGFAFALPEPAVTHTESPPVVLTTAVTSTPAALSDTYGRGETIEITVTYDEAVDVNAVNGTPYLRVNISPTPGITNFNYRPSTDTTEIVCEYTVHVRGHGRRRNLPLWHRQPKSGGDRP